MAEKYIIKGSRSLQGKKYTKLREEVGMVFQHFNLFSHMTVLENVMYAPVKVKKRNKGTVYMEAMDILEVVGLAGKKDVYPEMLSGGQKQRVAIARALVNDLRYCFVDEPLGALDAKLRKICRLSLKRFRRKLELHLFLLLTTRKRHFQCQIQSLF